MQVVTEGGAFFLPHQAVSGRVVGKGSNAMTDHTLADAARDIDAELKAAEQRGYERGLAESRPPALTAEAICDALEYRCDWCGGNDAYCQECRTTNGKQLTEAGHALLLIVRRYLLKHEN